MTKVDKEGMIPKDPKLRTTQVLVWLYRSRPDRFTARDVAQQFKLKAGEVQRRLQYLKIWGTIKIVGKIKAHRRGRQEIEYGLTDWGKKYSAKVVKK